jgi:hypothetical protein
MTPDVMSPRKREQTGMFGEAAAVARADRCCGDNCRGATARAGANRSEWATPAAARNRFVIRARAGTCSTCSVNVPRGQSARSQIIDPDQSSKSQIAQTARGATVTMTVGGCRQSKQCTALINTSPAIGRGKGRGRGHAAGGGAMSTMSVAF